MPIAVVALLGLTLAVVIAAGYHSVERMTEAYSAGRRRFALSVICTPLAFVVLAACAWASGEPFYLAALPFLALAWLAIFFWEEL